MMSCMRQWGLAWLMGAVVILAVGCGKPKPTGQSAEAAYDPRTDPIVNPPSLLQPPPDDPNAIAMDETLYLSLSGSPSTLNPLFSSSAYEGQVMGLLFTGPFSFDKAMQWKINDELVESFEESADHTTFTVKLKPGFTWQDGQPFTAHDIAYSWQQILDPNVPCPAIKPGTDKITECVALDDLTVKYVQAEPLATSRWNMFFPILPKHILAEGKQANPDLRSGDFFAAFNRNPVGSGPYRLVEWAENEKVVLERWDGYKGARPTFNRIVFRIIPDSNVSLLSFEKQQVDFVGLSAQQFAKETDSAEFKKVGYKAWGTQWAFGYIGWNMDGSNPFFKDVRVRRAMTHALNLPLIIEKVYYNLATPCRGIYHPESWMYNPAVQPLAYDVKAAAALLDEAGWRVNPETGWRAKDVDGERVEFEFTLLIPQGSPTGPKVAAIYQDDLKRLGIRLKSRTLEWATFMQTVRKHEFQAEIAGWGTGTDPDTGWNLWRTEEYETGRNYGGYSNARVDALFEQGRKEFDQAKRAAIYQEIHKLIYDDQPYTWIYNAPILAGFNKRIRGVDFSPRGVMGFDPGMLAWWVAKGEVDVAP